MIQGWPSFILFPAMSPSPFLPTNSYLSPEISKDLGISLFLL